jgi:ubiquinone/menaquinone biosynthesis C-methylase UbiE
MGAIRDYEHAGWQAAASSYDGFAGATRLFVPSLLQAAGVRAGMRVLDVACGTGVASGAAEAAGARVTAVDFSPAMLLTARSLHPAVQFHIGDAEALPLAATCFDAAISNFGIHHVENPARAIAEVHRVLRPGATFAFTFWADPQDNTPWRIVYEAIRARGRLDVPMPAGTSAHATPDNFSRLMSAAGFDKRGIRHDLVTQEWSLQPDADLVGIFDSGTVRTATLLRGQGSALSEVRRKVAQDARRYLRDGRIVLPTRAYLIAASA